MLKSFVSTQKNSIPPFLLGQGNDAPENGGFTGAINDKPNPFIVKEERPKTIDPKTGELVYSDKLKPLLGIIYLLG